MYADLYRPAIAWKINFVAGGMDLQEHSLQGCCGI
jgi:hypothetical protein